MLQFFVVLFNFIVTRRRGFWPFLSAPLLVLVVSLCSACRGLLSVRGQPCSGLARLRLVVFFLSVRDRVVFFLIAAIWTRAGDKSQAVHGTLCGAVVVGEW